VVAVLTPSTRGSRVLAACTLPPGRLLLLSRRLLSVLLLDAVCCCLVLLPLIATGLFIACWLHGCYFSWRVLLLALGQVRRSHCPRRRCLLMHAVICIMPAACFLRPRAACFRLPARCFGFGLLEMLVCVLDREEEMLFHVSYGVVCGQRTVAACCEIKTGLEWQWGARHTVPDSWLLFAVRYRARGPRFWVGNWAQNLVLKIKPPSGPAGWYKVCAPGVIRTPCQAKARVTVGMVSQAQARLVLCAVLCPSQMVPSL
jgi:hypothetical protein